MADRDEVTPVRVLMVAVYYPYPVVGGMEKQAHELGLALREQGIQVQVLSVRHDVGHGGVDEVDGITVIRLPWGRSRLARLLLTTLAMTVAMVRRRREFDLVHVHVPSWFGLMSIVIARLLNKRVMTKLPNIGARGIPGLRARRFGRTALRILRSSNAIVAMTPESVQELDEIEYPRSRVLTTSNGVLITEKPSRKGEEEERPVRVVFVGRLVAQKGVEVLLEAWSLLPDASRSHAVLELWGEGPELMAMQRRAAALNIHGSVVFRGHVEGAADRISAMDVFVLPSYIEGNSNALLEAMVAALPAVATRTGGNPMLMGPAGERWLVEPGDPRALAARLGRLIEDAGLREQLGDALREQVERRFDIRAVAQTYRRAYVLIVGGNQDHVCECTDTWPFAVE